MWYRALCGAVGRITINLFFFLAAMTFTVWTFFAVQPYWPAVSQLVTEFLTWVRTGL